MFRTPVHVWALAALTPVILALAAWRWHAFQSSRPEAVHQHVGAAAVAVLQFADCPDSRAQAERFLALVGERGVPVLTVQLPDRDWLRDPTSGLQEVRRAWAHRGLHRALLRSGIEATPALLLVDSRGIVRFVYRVEPDVPDDLLAGSADAFAGAYRLLARDDEAPPVTPAGPGSTLHSEDLS